MKCTLLGFKEMDFETNDGGRINGITLFFAYPDGNTTGSACEGKFIQRTVFDSFGIETSALADAVDQVVNIEYGPKNKIVGLELV